HAADVAFFGGFALFSLIGAVHQDRRKLATEPARFRPFYEGTPFIPFTGRATLQGLRELLPVVAPVGIAVAVVVRHFHGSWFGGVPLTRPPAPTRRDYLGRRTATAGRR